MNNLPYFFLEPYDCSMLTKIRLGNKGDGGYCLPQEMLKEIKQVVTFGVNDEDSFEIDLDANLAKDQGVVFYLCDPFCVYTARPGNEKFNFLQLGLGNETSEEKKMTSWSDFRKNLGSQENIFLKVDIEFAEWDSFENLKSEDFMGVELLVIEFHSLLSRFDDTNEKMCKVLKLLNDQYYLYHLHANNNGLIFKIEDLGFLPDVIECTYIKKSWAEKYGYTFKPRQKAYPEELDIPCHEIKFDPIIDWWDSTILQQLCKDD